MSEIIIKDTPIKKLKIIEHKPNKDFRGFLSREFCQKKFSQLLEGKNIQQINRSLTKKKGTVRGLHFQFPPYAEIKIVSCLRGKVWDIAVDLRKGSSTFLCYHAEILSQNDHKSFLIPEGFAHGFQTLTENCELLYLHTKEYNKSLEGTVNATDPRIQINWPLPIKERSERDIKQSSLNSKFEGIDL
jgi:dTDP-4-dehydrorhamnose 3,5-epimerase